MTCNVHVMHVITCNNIPGVSLMTLRPAHAAADHGCSDCDSEAIQVKVSVAAAFTVPGVPGPGQLEP